MFDSVVFDSVLELFEAQVSRTPYRIAISVVGSSNRLTYRELDIQSNRLARKLIGLGLQPGQLAGVCLERSPEYLTSVLAVLKSGAAFLPLDPRYPVNRLDFMLRDSGAPVLLSTRERLWNGALNQARTVLLDEDAVEIERESGDPPGIQTTAGSLAYVAYTSGSSGRPKGVLCPQSGLLNRMAWMASRFPYQAGEIASQMVALSFVDSVYEIFSPLLHGVELRVIPSQLARGSPLELMRAVSENRITRIIVVPTVLSHWLDCMEGLDRDAFSLKYCFVSGEVLFRTLAERFRRILPNTRLINFYGASELCQHATWFEVNDIQGRTAPIGRPIANTEVYVLDSTAKPAPDGVAGEIYMGGPGMARGYLNQPELTAERFVENPFGAPGSKLFKTGDLGRYLETGDLEYLGRVDQQVKIRGCRVEPAEVEDALRSHPAVKEAAAGAREDGRGEQRLVAWVSLREPGLANAADLRGFLKDTLPAYLIPSEFVFLDSLPRLPNRKINRLELPEPMDSRASRKRSGQPPRAGVETRLAAIWEELLGCGTVDRGDDFFDLGGDSLLAARFTAMIEQAFGTTVPVDLLLEFPTLSQFAIALEEKRPSIYPRHIVPIQPLGSRMRFFCFGAGPDIVALARRLPADQPVFGIRLDERDTEWLQPAATIKEIAERLVPYLREFQPRGPYCLGGYSMNGLLAYEAARRLRDQGQEVALVILLDTYLGENARDLCPSLLRASSQFLSIGERITDADPKAALRHLGTLARRGWSFVRRRLKKPGSLRPADSPKSLTALLSEAEAAYCPQPYPGRIVMLEAREQILGRAAGARFGWRHLSQAEFEIRTVPGEHHTILLAPNVDAVAREIAACLEHKHDPVDRQTRLGIPPSNVVR